jgi:mono/diheme cytochrome c family protein
MPDTQHENQHPRPRPRLRLLRRRGAHERLRPALGIAVLILFGIACAAGFLACDDSSTDPKTGPETLDPALVAQGREIFRYESFDDERFWTDTARMHEVVQQGVSPSLALKVGLKVDADALPQAVKDAIAAGQVDLNSPATTVTLLKLGAVVGLKGTVATVGGRDTLTRLGITCALCHSTVDNSFAPGIGRRLDGHQNSDLNVGAIVALSPAIPAATKAILNSWGPGRYDARTNFDGLNMPALIPPVYGLAGVSREISTGDDTLSYWNAYVAVTQMHGQGTFRDARLGINITKSPDVVTPLLPALRQYQLSLTAPKPAAGSFDAAAAARGQALFRGAAQCAGCHTGALLTDVNAGTLHTPAEVGQSVAFANRSVTKRYRTTPLRALALHAPYFHDGGAATLGDVVTHYDQLFALKLSAQQKADLVEYLKSL